MDTIAQLFFGSMAMSFKAQSDSQALLHAQLAYGLQMDNRLLTGALMNEMFTGSDPSKYADFNTAARIPSTLGHQIQSPDVPQPLPK